MKHCILTVILVSGLVFSQSTGLLENFNDNMQTDWHMPSPDTFTITEADQALRIDYNRIASSGLWDCFYYILPEPVNISSEPSIAIRVKSDVAAELTLKPIYGDGDGWLTVSLPPDQIWHTCRFSLDYSGSESMTRIYFYLDGGSTAESSGTVWFDDLRIADSVQVSVDLTGLESAIGQAQQLIQILDEGNQEGQVPPGSKNTFQSAIDHAVDFTRSDLSGTLQEAVALETEQLVNACVTFETSVHLEGIDIIDAGATRETWYLFENLRMQAENYLLFGMHDATGYGVGWSGDLDRSDVRDVCGDYPAVYSWDLTRITSADNQVNTEYQMRSAFERGGVNTMCWHQRDPEGRGFYAEDVNDERIVETLLPGGEYHEFYKDKLERAGLFFKSLRDSQGRSIPVIFRPYHEHDGSWFWWGVGHCTVQEYVDLWRFTVHYLRDSLNVHNLIYAFSPSTQSKDTLEYKARYPGDDYVDILGFDHYFDHPVVTSELTFFKERLRDIAQMALDRNKVNAVTEVGQESLPTEDWFTRVLLEPIKMDSLASFTAYAAVWRNANTTHHYAPYPGHASVPDFLEFYQDPYTLFEQDLPDLYIKTGPDVLPPEFTGFPESPMIAVTPKFTVNLETDERAYVRYSLENQDFDQMPNTFETGEGSRYHTTTWTGSQGETITYYLHTRDMLGNTSSTATELVVTIDTLQREITWKDGAYPDTGWLAGITPIGTGNSGDVTVTHQAHTLYFRRHFSLDTIPDALGLLVKCHDGAVAYVNGYEFGRSNLNEGQTIVHTSSALSSTPSNRVMVLDEAAMQNLYPGNNLLAVEVHAAGLTDTDLSFDAQLFDATRVYVSLGSGWLYYTQDSRPENTTLGEIITGVKNDPAVRPGHFRLYPGSPNPFNPVTRIRYELPRSADVGLIIYDLLGHRIATEQKKKKSPGMHVYLFDGSHLPSGIYIVELITDRQSLRQKIMLMK